MLWSDAALPISNIRSPLMAGTDSRIITANHDQGAAGVYVHRPPQRVTELLSLALERPREAAQKLDEMLGGARSALGQRGSVR